MEFQIGTPQLEARGISAPNGTQMGAKRDPNDAIVVAMAPKRHPKAHVLEFRFLAENRMSPEFQVHLDLGPSWDQLGFPGTGFGGPQGVFGVPFATFRTLTPSKVGDLNNKSNPLPETRPYRVGHDIGGCGA